MPNWKLIAAAVALTVLPQTGHACITDFNCSPAENAAAKDIENYNFQQQQNRNNEQLLEMQREGAMQQERLQEQIDERSRCVQAGGTNC
jgi:hypothetical protein